ncbi:MAG: helix-turn-helix transcriptional regulator [Pseudonocardiaceae bacterium]
MDTTTTGDTLPVHVGRQLRLARKRAGLLPEHAALETGLTARVISDLERGYRVPRLAYLRVLADLYQVPITDLIGTESVPPR